MAEGTPETICQTKIKIIHGLRVQQLKKGANRKPIDEQL